jgi:ATP-dependent Lon protease
VFDLPGAATLWWLGEDVEEAFDLQWELWLDHAGDWKPYFEQLAETTTQALPDMLAGLGLVDSADTARANALAVDSSGRSLRIADVFDGSRAAVEYYHTSFSYTDMDTGEERFVGVPEQGGRNLISSDPLSPGSIYTASVAQDGTVGMFRVEVSVAAGTGKLRLAGGVSGATKESINRAFSYMLSKKDELSIAKELDASDLHVEVIDLLNNRVEGEIGLGFFIAAFSALKKAPPAPAMLVLGDMSVQGNIKTVRSLVEPLQVAMDNGAKRALIPIENKRSFLEVTGDVVEHVDPIFFGDAKTAAFKALGLN